MNTNIIWYGHSTVQVQSGNASVVIDPFFTHNPTCTTSWTTIGNPDVVLVTHDHGDHVGDTVELCKTTGAVCGCVVGTGEKLVQAGLPATHIPAGIGFNIGGTIEVNGIRITMVQAFHTSESGVPVGYVVTMPGGFTFYHAGDTGLFGDMALIGRLYPLDLAFLPCGGFFTMDGQQAAEAVALLRVPAVVPIHWGTFPVIAKDTTLMATHLARLVPTCHLITMKPGQTVTL